MFDSRNFRVKVTLISLSGITRVSGSSTVGADPNDKTPVKAYSSFSPRSSRSFITSKPLPLSSSSKPVAYWEANDNNGDVHCFENDGNVKVSSPSSNQRPPPTPKRMNTSPASQLSKPSYSLESPSTYLDIQLLAESDENHSEMNKSAVGISSLSPELVNIDVGLTQGNQIIHLGVATFVISGEDLQNQTLDLPVRREQPSNVGSENGSIMSEEENMRNLSLTDSNVSSKEKKVKSKRRGLRSLFTRAKDGKKLNGPLESVTKEVISFKNDHFKYGIAPNAILRVKIDCCGADSIVSSPMVQSEIENSPNSEIGNVKSYNNEESSCSNSCREVYVYTSNLDDSIEVLTSDIEVNASSNLSPDKSNANFNESSVDHDGENNSFDEPEPAVPTRSDSPSIYTKFEVTSIKLSNDSKKRSRKFKSIKTPEVTREPNLIERVGVAVTASNFCGMSQMIADVDSFSDYSEENRGILRYSSSIEEEEEEATEYKSELLNQNTFDGTLETNLGGTYDENDTDDDGSTFAQESVGQATIESLEEAKETLRRYATRVGVNVGQLLNEDEEESEGEGDENTLQSSTIASCTIGDGTCENTLGYTVETYGETHDEGSRTDCDNSTIQSGTSDESSAQDSHSRRR